MEQLLSGNCTTAPSYKMVECAEMLVDTVACADWAFFMKNGTDATTFGILTARAATGPEKDPVPEGVLPRQSALGHEGRLSRHPAGGSGE